MYRQIIKYQWITGTFYILLITGSILSTHFIKDDFDGTIFYYFFFWLLIPVYVIVISLKLRVLNNPLSWSLPLANLYYSNILSLVMTEGFEPLSVSYMLISGIILYIAPEKNNKDGELS